MEKTKESYLKIITILAIILGIGLTTVSDYGVSWDEGTEISTVKYNFELITKGREIPKDLKYYGVLFNLTSEVIYQIKQYAVHGWSYNPLGDQKLEEGDRGVAQAIYQRLQVKHPFTFLVSLLAYIGVAGMVEILTGLDFAWFGPIILALFPRFWADSFYNPKDIPFAALFTLATWLGALLIDFYLKQSSFFLPGKLRLGCNKITLYSLGYGVLVGLVSATRIGGFCLLLFIILAHFFTRLNFSKIIQDIGHYWLFYGLMIMAWAGTTTLLYPASWAHPVLWFQEALHYLSHHTWPGINIFEGRSIAAKEIPWYYLPRWLSITTPVLWQVSFLMGLIFSIANYLRLTNRQRACVVLVLLQVFFLPGMAIVRHSPLYNGMRQFLFILPGIAVIAAAALIWLYQTFGKQWLRLVSLTLIVVLINPIVWDMISLHPHQYVYFNRFVGGLAGAYQVYDTDYWGVSLREGVEWVNIDAKDGQTLAIGGPQYIGEMFAKPGLKVVDLEKELDYGRQGQADYYVAMPYLNLQGVFPDCPIAHQVTRQGVPLSIVRKCP